MRLVFYIAIGGALGTLARYWVQGLLQPAGGTFPIGTLLVNVAGAFALGFLMRYLLGSGVLGPELRAALTIGFCGGFTTMSTFSYETVALLADGEYLQAGVYLLGSAGGSLAAVVGGIAAANRFL